MLRLLAGGAGSVKSEYFSPAPPHELSFSRDAAADLTSFTRLLRSLGAAAPPISPSGHSGSAIHVHVNVGNPEAAGEPLSALEILDVYFAWVQFDLVGCRLPLRRPTLRLATHSSQLTARNSQVATHKSQLTG